VTDEAQPELFPVEKKRHRSPNGINLHRWLEGYGIDVLPYEQGRSGDARPANVIYGGRTVARLMRKDMDRAGTVIRCIQVSNPKCFEDVIIWAVWCFITAHFAHRPAQDAINHFRAIDIAVIRKRAQRIVCGSYGRGAKTWTAIYALLADAIIEKDMAA